MGEGGECSERVRVDIKNSTRFLFILPPLGEVAHGAAKRRRGRRGGGIKSLLYYVVISSFTTATFTPTPSSLCSAGTSPNRGRIKIISAPFLRCHARKPLSGIRPFSDSRLRPSGMTTKISIAPSAIAAKDNALPLTKTFRNIICLFSPFRKGSGPKGRGI
jgi:hypothetical protein